MQGGARHLYTFLILVGTSIVNQMGPLADPGTCNLKLLLQYSRCMPGPSSRAVVLAAKKPAGVARNASSLISLLS